jgi:putative phosphoribosyl transferase
VPVGFEAAKQLHADLDVFLVRKIGVPGHEELAMGAIASGGVQVLNQSTVKKFGISPEAVDYSVAREQKEIERREALYRESRPAAEIAARTVILTDDGLATGATMLAAVRAVRVQKPSQLVVAAPVASRQACESFQALADRVVCLATPEPFYAVGLWYEEFTQTTDEEVRALLQTAAVGV